MRRIVTVTYTDPMYGQVTEDYGPFEDNQHLAAWLDVQDDRVTFGNHFRMELKLLGSVTVQPLPTLVLTEEARRELVAAMKLFDQTSKRAMPLSARRLRELVEDAFDGRGLQ